MPASESYNIEELVGLLGFIEEYQADRAAMTEVTSLSSRACSRNSRNLHTSTSCSSKTMKRSRKPSPSTRNHLPSLFKVGSICLFRLFFRPNFIESNENPSAALNLISEMISGKSSSPLKEQTNAHSLPKMSALEEELEAQKEYINELKESFAELQRKLANKYGIR
jgi:hypothetical protein